MWWQLIQDSWGRWYVTGPAVWATGDWGPCHPSASEAIGLARKQGARLTRANFAGHYVPSDED